VVRHSSSLRVSSAASAHSKYHSNITRARHPAAAQRHNPSTTCWRGQATSSSTCGQSLRGCRIFLPAAAALKPLWCCVQGCHQVWAVQPCLPLQHAWCWCIQDKVDEKHMGPRRAGVLWRSHRLLQLYRSLSNWCLNAKRMQQLCDIMPHRVQLGRAGNC
jgi:hypothetical protein